MRIVIVCMAALVLVAPELGAQDDAAARAKARQDSIAKAVRDSIALMKELGGALATPADSAAQNQPVGPSPARRIRVSFPTSVRSGTSCSTSPPMAAPRRT